MTSNQPISVLPCQNICTKFCTKILYASYRILDSSLDDKKVRVQDTVPLMMTLVKLGGRNQVWNFIEENFDGLAERYFGIVIMSTSANY